MKIDGYAADISIRPGLPKLGDQLETAFLAQMLKIAMPDAGAGAFGGGTGESQFSSFLVERHASALASRLDLGLAGKLGADHG